MSETVDLLKNLCPDLPLTEYCRDMLQTTYSLSLVPSYRRIKSEDCAPYLLPNVGAELFPILCDCSAELTGIHSSDGDVASPTLYEPI